MRIRIVQFPLEYSLLAWQTSESLPLICAELDSGSVYTRGFDHKRIGETGHYWNRGALDRPTGLKTKPTLVGRAAALRRYGHLVLGKSSFDVFERHHTSEHDEVA